VIKAELLMMMLTRTITGITRNASKLSHDGLVACLDL